MNDNFSMATTKITSESTGTTQKHNVNNGSLGDENHLCVTIAFDQQTCILILAPSPTKSVDL